MLDKLSEIDKADLSCEICEGEGWVCEDHPKEPWLEGDHCDAAGQPCKCNQLNEYLDRFTN
jgi:hypothetical protein